MHFLGFAIAVIGTIYYGWSCYNGWYEQLKTATVSDMQGTTRFNAWINVVLSSDLTHFPSNSRELANYSASAQSSSKLIEFSSRKAVSYVSTREAPVLADDLGLYYVGMLLVHLGFDHVFLAMLWFTVLVHAAVMGLFLLTCCRNELYVFPLIVVVVYSASKAENVFGVWQPYEYVPLLALVLYSLYKKSSAQGPSRFKWHDKLELGSYVLLIFVLVWIRSSSLVTIIAVGLILLAKVILDQFRLPSNQRTFLILIAVPLLLLYVVPRIIVSKQYLEYSPAQHVFWHTIWCSLGEFPNDLQFRWSDYEASLRAHSLAKSPIIDLSPEYEAILRDDIISTLRRQPGFFLDVLNKKMSFRSEFFFPSALLCLAAGIPLVAFRKRAQKGFSRQIDTVSRNSEAFLFVVFPLLSTKVTVLLSSSHPWFSYALVLGEQLAMASAIVFGLIGTGAVLRWLYLKTVKAPNVEHWNRT